MTLGRLDPTDIEEDGMASEAERVASTAAGATKDVASASAEQGRHVAATAADEAKHIVEEATAQVGELAGTAKEQASAIADRAKQDLRDQAEAQTNRLADGLRGIAEQMQALVDGRASEAGQLPDLARHASDQLQSLAARVGDRGVDGILDDAQGFARRRPGMFLAGAAAVGFLGGRLLRGAQAASQHEQQQRAMRPPLDPYSGERLGDGGPDGDVITLTEAPGQTGRVPAANGTGRGTR